MSKDGVVPPQGGPSRRPAGGPANHSGADTPQGPAARRFGAQGHAAQPHGAGRGPHAEHGGTTENPEGTAADRSWFEAVAGRSEADAQGDPQARNGTAGADADAGGMQGGASGAATILELDLGAALRSRVAVVGVCGPPPGGLARIRRNARTRQRNRAVLAGSAGILMLAVSVTLATGDRFDLVPKLTGAVGLSGGIGTGSPTGVSGSSRASAAANGGHVVWPTGTTGRTGLAIGPVAPITSTPSAAAAAKVPMCTAQTLKTNTTVGATIDGVAYGHVDAVAQSPCVVVGPPVLTVANEAGTASSSVVILKETKTAAAQLPTVTTWGTTMVLDAGDSYQFQFAWDAVTCAQSSASPTSSTLPSPTGSSTYYLGYAVTGTTPATAVTFTASCGAKVYVTDIYRAGAFPLPKAPSPPPATSSSAPPPTSPEPSTATSTTPPADTSSPSPSASPAAPNGVTATGNSTTPTG